uniref:Zinc-finger domain-containing protein n=1 Tax=Kalanchoe fedtschenkoi TaxID=63787 RepID=A0A7N0ZXI7_KALFE
MASHGSLVDLLNEEAVVVVQQPDLTTSSGDAPQQSEAGIRSHTTVDTNGPKKYCHQCRGPLTSATGWVSCTKMKKSKICPMLVCRRCLKDRYGERMEGTQIIQKVIRNQETVDEPMELTDWVCPKCRGICNCSRCQIKRGEKPTGRKGLEDLMTIIGHQGDAVTDQLVKEADEEDITAPPAGAVLNIVADINMLADDVGPAIHFIEFFKAFGEVFRLDNKVDSKLLLNDLFYYKPRKQPSDEEPLVVAFQKVLLTFIQVDVGRWLPTTWLEGFYYLVCRANYPLTALQLETASISQDQYDELEPSSKLRILTFLCDEVLSTEALRTHIWNAETEKKKRRLRSIPEASENNLPVLAIEAPAPESAEGWNLKLILDVANFGILVTCSAKISEKILILLVTGGSVISLNKEMSWIDTFLR